MNLTATRPSTTQPVPSEHVGVPGRDDRRPARRLELPRLATSPLLLSALLIVAVFGPYLAGGTVLFLDFRVGPQPHLSAPFWGFPPAFNGLAPVEGVLVSLWQVSTSGPARLVPFLLVVPLAAWGFNRLLGRTVAAVSGTVFYVVNPFVHERLASGQATFLIGYALLPLLVATIVHAAADGNRRRDMVAIGALLALLVALAPHYLFIGAILVIPLAVTAAARERGRVVIALVGGALWAAGLSLYWIIATVHSSASLAPVNHTSLQAFRTASDTRIGAAGNLVGLYGFWRQSTGLTKDSLPIWPIVLLVILAVTAVGVRRDREHRWLIKGLAVAAVLGFALALGDQGPTGPAFRFLFDHAPGFRVMREPEKFAATIALFYAVGFGIGVQQLFERRTGAARKWLLVGLLLLPALYTYRMLWGLGGSVRPSRFPSSWAEADRLMGSGPEKVLAFPWERYPTLAFAQGRAVGTPIPSYFRRDAIVAEDLEVADIPTAQSNPVSSYVSSLLTHSGEITHLGNLVAPVGAKYVLLVKTDNWQQYRWLYHQTDLELVLDRPDLALFENREPVALAYATSKQISATSIDAVIRLSDRVRLTDYAIELGNQSDRAPTAPTAPTAPAAPSRALVPVSHSPVHDDFGPVTGARYIVFAESFDTAWRLRGARPQANLGATNVFTLPASGEADVNITYHRWPTVRAGYATSAAVAFAACLVAAFPWLPGRRRRLARRTNRARRLTG